MFIELLKELIYDNSFLYLSILVIIFSFFLVSILINSIKIFNISKNIYYSNIFYESVWVQSIEKSKNSASLIKDLSIIAKIFLIGLKTFSDEIKSVEDSESEHCKNKIELTKSVMKIHLKKEIHYFKSGLNLLSLSSMLIPYIAISMAIWEIILIFNTNIAMSDMTLIMFVNSFFVIMIGLLMSIISLFLYLICLMRIDEISDNSYLFIEEFANNLNKKYYKQEKNDQ